MSERAFLQALPPGVQVEQLPSGNCRLRVLFRGRRIGIGTIESRDEAIGVGVAALQLLEENPPVTIAVRSHVPDGPGVYVLRTRGAYAKIGRASNVRRRMKEIQQGEPTPLRFLGLLSTDPRDESLWHKRLARHRVRGEWFRWHEDISKALAGELTL